MGVLKVVVDSSLLIQINQYSNQQDHDKAISNMQRRQQLPEETSVTRRRGKDGRA
jgi:hypothetical protein